ncbi:proline-rich protein 12-like [Sorex araneus]|uniref:proline-rich protein 12-like n=1 Tax=Sorex araneus TaxID=42254 RepID=UPI0024338E88|nr:proline-rich protein 12-like [Sorex araneus]
MERARSAAAAPHSRRCQPHMVRASAPPPPHLGSPAQDGDSNRRARFSSLPAPPPHPPAEAAKKMTCHAGVGGGGGAGAALSAHTRTHSHTHCGKLQLPARPARRRAAETPASRRPARTPRARRAEHGLAGRVRQGDCGGAGGGGREGHFPRPEQEGPGYRRVSCKSDLASTWPLNSHFHSSSSVGGMSLRGETDHLGWISHMGYSLCGDSQDGCGGEVGEGAGKGLGDNMIVRACECGLGL